MQAQVSRPALPPQEGVVPIAVANRGYGRKDPANEQCRYCTMISHFVRTCRRLNHDIMRRRCSRSLKGKIFGPQRERINWNSPGGMRRAVIILNNLDVAVVEAEPVADIVWDQPRGRGPQVNFILGSNGQDRVNITTRRAGAEKRLIRDTVMEEVARTSTNQGEPETGEPEKVYGKSREEEPIDKATAAKKKFRYQIPILTMPEIDDTLSKLLGTMLQTSPRLLKGLRQLLTRRRVEVEEALKPQEQETEEAEAPQGVANLQRIPGDLKDVEKAFADIRLSLPDREGGEVMRAPPRTTLSFHALPVGKLKVQIGTHHTDALVDGGVKITLIRRDFATITGCTVNKEVTGSIRGASGEISFAGYVTKCAVKAGIKESIWSFQRMTVMEEMDHDIILGRPWCANVEMIGMHLHDGTYMVDIEDPLTSRGELLRLLGTVGDPPKGKLATWSPTFEDSARKGAFARMKGMRERVEIMIEEAFSKKERIKIGLPLKKRRQENEYKPVGKKAKLVSILVETSKEEAMEKEEEILRVIRERRAAEGHWIPDEVADTMKIGIDWFLTVEETQLIRKACQEFYLAFAFNDHQKGRLDAKLISPVRIHTVELKCWNDKGSAYEFGIAAEVTELVRAKIDSFVAEPTASPYANKWFVFRKPNKTLRWIQDSQMLNAVTIRDAGSLPQTDLPAESHAGQSIYSLIDLYSEYDQLSLDARDRPYTAMHTPVGQLQMQVTPMGFTNAVAETQRRMLAVDGDMFPEKCEPYIDDNPIKGAQNKDETEVQPGVRKFVWDHLQDIKDLLQRFLVYNITASGPKSILAVPEVTILGYIVDARDNLCGYIEAVALKRKMGKGVADWVEDFDLRHPFIRRFIADNGTEFVNYEVLSRLKTLCAPIKIIEPYHPEANAPVERGHRTLKNTIAKLAADDLGNWPRNLKQAVFAENMTPKRTTGCIPAELWYGREIDFPMEALVSTWNRLDNNPHMSTEELITARCQQVLRNEEALEDVVKRVMDSRMRDKARWDQVKNIRKEPLQDQEKKENSKKDKDGIRKRE
ncbi:hypothetical protein CBR_g64854 [Chara braunii]|uniref:Integrase catalytic domain-containing protein n=1 Tax=Chara braunii TaxID=69332 RepID=A0A388K947_CHABU|nr:hypothetical protein CBR_g64854 [Chara braunii]|eukprot:GBG66582.1 hypothetical protein CBR_g64854 [Chara braunii]